MTENDFESRLAKLLQERAEHSVEAFDAATVAETAIAGAGARGPMHRLWRALRTAIEIVRPARYAVATIVVVALAFVGGGALLFSGGPGGAVETPTPQPTPVPTATPSPTPTPVPTPSGPTALLGLSGQLTPGAYQIDQPYPWRIVFEMPAGWAAVPVSADALGVVVHSHDTGWGVVFALVGTVSVDPCRPEAGMLDASVSQSADALVNAFTSWPGFTTTTQETTIAGYPATRIELTRAYDPASCPNALLFQTPFYGEIRPAWGSVSHLFQLTVIDVNGTPLVLRTTDYPETSEAMDALGLYPHNAAIWASAETQMQAILDSIQITPN